MNQRMHSIARIADSGSSFRQPLLKGVAFAAVWFAQATTSMCGKTFRSVWAYS
jgi:hypothetical protein